jgi:hypothetical protein
MSPPAIPLTIQRDALEDVKTADENQGVDSYNGARGDEDEKVPASDGVPPSDYN